MIGVKSNPAHALRQSNKCNFAKIWGKTHPQFLGCSYFLGVLVLCYGKIAFLTRQSRLSSV